MKPRESHIAGIYIGRKHTGKSTDLMRDARSFIKTHPLLRVLILDVNGSPAYNAVKTVITPEKLHLWKSGVAKMIGTPTDETLEKIAETFRNGLVIFEDCTKYIQANVQPKIKAFLVDHRMMGCDLIFTFHSWNRVPPFFWEMTSYVTIKKTQDNIDAPRNRQIVPNYDQVAAAYRRVAANKSDYYSETVDLMI